MARPPDQRSPKGASLFAGSVVRFLYVFTIALPSLVSYCCCSASSGQQANSSGKVATPSRIISKFDSSSSSSSSSSSKRVLQEPPVLSVDVNEFIDERSRQQAKQRRGARAGDSGEGADGVYYLKKTEVFHPAKAATNKQLMRTKWKRKKRSMLKSEGDHLLKSLGKLGTHTTHGVCRAVNVTGNAAAVVAGGVFKIAGAAILDGVDGMEYVSAQSPKEVHGIAEAYRFLKTGLRTTGKAVYDLGVAAENMTAEATEAAEETLRNFVETVVETATDLRTTGDDAWKNEATATGYFSAEEARIVDNIMLDMPMSYPSAGRDGATVEKEDDGDDDMINDTPRGGRQANVLANGTYSNPSSSSCLSPSTTSLRRGPRATFLERARRAIRRSIIRTNRVVPSMRFPQMVACGFVFACRAVTANPWCGAASFVGARMYLKFVEPIYLECLRERMMSDIKFEAVARLHEGSPERARWFNTAVGVMWVPMIEPLLSRWMARQIAASIERSLPSDVSWVGLGKVTLGPTPPKVRYVRVQNVTSLAARTSMGQSNAVIDSVLVEVGQPGGDVHGENVVYLEMGVDWISPRSKVTLKLGEQKRRRLKWWHVRSYVPSYRVKLCDFGIQAKVVLALAIGEGRPYVKRLWLSFSEPPRTHLSLEALHGMDLANLPVLRKHLKHVVMRCVLPITEPKHLALEMKPPPLPQNLNRRAVALAGRAVPGTTMGRRGVLRRIPIFGLRTIVGNRAARAAAAAAEQARASGRFEVGEEYEPARQALEEATKRLLVEVGGNRKEMVMAAAHHQLATAGESSERSGEDVVINDDDDDGSNDDEPAVLASLPPAQTQGMQHLPVTMIEANPTTKCSMVGATTALARGNTGDVGGMHTKQKRWGGGRRSGRGSLQVEEAELKEEGGAETGVCSSKVDDDQAERGGGVGGGVADLLIPPEPSSTFISDAVDELVALQNDEAELHVAEGTGVILPAGKERRKAVHARRAEIKKRRAAELDARRPGRRKSAKASPAKKFLQQQWFNGGGRWRRWRVLTSARGKGKKGASPQREEMVKLVIALSRPPLSERVDNGGRVG